MFTQQTVKDYQIKYPHTKYGFHKWNNCILYEWEYKLLIDKNAISSRGILQNYPILKVIKGNGDCDYKDLGGNSSLIYQKIRDINNSGTQQRAEMDYSCKNYDEWRKFKSGDDKKERQQQYAIKLNTPPGMVDVSQMNF